jgi:DNA-binding transcriptional MocR family regulator
MDISGKTAVDIAASFEKAFLAGAADSDGALPTVRRLAVSLGVSPTTVAAAYKLLRNRGLVVGQGRQGTRVAIRPLSPITPVPPTVPVGTRDLATGEPDGSLLPSLDHTLRTIQLEPRESGIGPDRAGLVAFASSEFDADDIPAGAVAVVSGGLDAIERILREHLRAGDRIALEDPAFPGIVDLVRASGYGVVPFAVDDEGPVPGAVDAALARRCHAIVVTPRAQDPTGAALSQTRAAELREVLRRFPRVALIEHDCAGPVAGMPLQTLRNSSHERWAVVRSLSKFLGPDLRVAVMAGDDVTIARVRGRQALGARWVSHILQQLALTLWADPAHGRRIARAREIYTQRRTAAIAALSAQGIPAHGRSGFNVWVPVRDERGVVRALAEKGWAVAAGERFRIQSAAGIRVTVSTLSVEDAARFASDLAGVLRSASARFA